MFPSPHSATVADLSLATVLHASHRPFSVMGTERLLIYPGCHVPSLFTLASGDLPWCMAPRLRARPQFDPICVLLRQERLAHRARLHRMEDGRHLAASRRHRPAEFPRNLHMRTPAETEAMRQKRALDLLTPQISTEATHRVDTATPARAPTDLVPRG